MKTRELVIVENHAIQEKSIRGVSETFYTASTKIWNVKAISI